MDIMQRWAMEDQEVSANKRQYATIKGEIKTNRNGHKLVVFKEGQQYISRMPEQCVEMVKHAMLEENSIAGRGVDSKRVLEFIKSTIEFLEHGNPTVKNMRIGNVKAVQLLFHMEEIIKGSTKIRKTWAAENKPCGWPENVPFEDPNGGNQMRNERAAKDGQKNDKLRKDGLTKMYSYLSREFLSRRDEILQRRDEYVGSLPSALRANTINSPWAERLVLLHHRTRGVLQEAVSDSNIAGELYKLLDVMFTRTEDGEPMRIMFAELCCSIQTVIDVALITNKPDSEEIISSLREIYERYKVVTMDNSVEQMSKDTPECYTCLQLHQQPQVHHQSQQVTIVTKQEDNLLPQLKMLKMNSDMEGQPSTSMDTMCNSSLLRQTPPLYGSDMDYTERITDVIVHGKRKHDEIDG